MYGSNETWIPRPVVVHSLSQGITHAPLSQALQVELGPHGVYVQAVLPAAVRTEIWEHASKNVDELPAVMDVAELVDAALVGFDRREAVTIPPPPDEAQWLAYDAARQAMLPNVN